MPTVGIAQAALGDVELATRCLLGPLLECGEREGFRVKVPTSALSAPYAADAKLSIECGPGIGPSASMSVLT